MATFNCKRICILGNYSGRNAGDAAILAGILRDITSRYRNVEFLVPTLNPQFIKNTYREYHVRPIPLLPWKGCIKLLGVPVWNALRVCDLVLITDAILFDRRLFNPLHNYLSTLALWAPMLKRRNIPVVLYNVSLGPITTRSGQWCLERVLRASDIVLLRDEESQKVLKDLSPVSAQILKGADSALSAESCPEDQIRKLLLNEPIRAGSMCRVGININCYGDAYVRNGQPRVRPEKLLSVLAQVAEWIGQELKADIWLFGTQYMDSKILGDLQRRIRLRPSPPLLTNRKYSYAELAGLLSKIDLLIGMRTHALILASSVGTPLIGIVNYPKTYGYLERIGQEKQAIPLQDLELESIKALVRTTWDRRSILRQQIRHAVERERQLAWQAAEALRPYLETPNVAQIGTA